MGTIEMPGALNFGILVSSDFGEIPQPFGTIPMPCKGVIIQP